MDAGRLSKVAVSTPVVLWPVMSGLGLERLVGILTGSSLHLSRGAKGKEAVVTDMSDIIASTPALCEDKLRKGLRASASATALREKTFLAVSEAGRGAPD